MLDACCVRASQSLGRLCTPHLCCHIQPGSIFGFNADESTEYSFTHRHELAKGTMSFIVLSRQLGTLKNIMTSVIFRAESRSSRKRPEFPSLNSELVDGSKLFFPVGAHVFTGSQLY